MRSFRIKFIHYSLVGKIRESSSRANTSYPKSTCSYRCMSGAGVRSVSSSLGGSSRFKRPHKKSKLFK